MCHVMRTKAIALLLTYISLSAVSERAIAREAGTVAGEVKKAVTHSLEVHQTRGVSGLTSAVSDCWAMPRDFCLYLDYVSRRIAVGATYTGVPLDDYFSASSISKRGHTWLAPNGRGQQANDQYLHAVDDVMGRSLLMHRDKQFNGRP